MKALVAVLSVLTLLAACWVGLELRAKSKYDRARASGNVAYSVATMDQKTIAFLAHVQSDWRCWSDTTNGPDADALKVVGKSPTVGNLVRLYNYRMPAFSWFSPSQNREAAAQNLVKAKFMPISVDNQWHVSAGGQTAFLLCKSNVVALYRDEPTGLRVSYFAEKKKPVASPNEALHATAAAPGK